jgi:predicted DNA-binding transcriptional regulator AlpA
MKDFDRDAASRPVSIPAQVDAPNDSDSEATRDIPPASAERRSAKDSGHRDVVGATVDSGAPHASSTRTEGSACFEPPRVLATTLHLKRPRTGVVLPTRRMATPSERLSLPAKGSGQGGGGAKESLSEPLSKSAPPGGTIAATPNAPSSPFASSRVDDDREWRPPSPVAAPRSTTVSDTHQRAKSSRRDSGDTGPARTPTGSQTTEPVSAIEFLGDAHGLLREKEVAEILGLSSATLRNWRTRGDGPPFVRLSGRAIRYEPVALREWVAHRTRRSTSDKEGENG